ncbi:MAG: hypothetical protein PHY23_01045 [Oscillospiraceae bacterium]|nr:hypothetical protein [Oscillospiraceae bacterium]
MIKNLSQLKKQLCGGTMFEITAHCRPDCIGQHRRVTEANTQGFYSVIPDKPQSRVSVSNDGKGSWLHWSTARFWRFEKGVCELYDSDREQTEAHLLIGFRIEEREAA